LKLKCRLFKRDVCFICMVIGDIALFVQL
jgi:hypothetical protein